MRKLRTAPAVLGLATLAACTTTTTSPTGAGTASVNTAATELVLVSHESFAAGVTDETFAGFTADTGITVEVLAAGDAGSMLNQVILTKEDPIGDVLFGVDSTFLSRALAEDIFVAHDSPLLADVADELETDPQHRVTPIDYGDVCLNYDKEGFEAAALAPPDSLQQLVDPEYRSMLVVEHPATSSPGLAFLLASIDQFGEVGPFTWRDFWAGLRENDVEVSESWDDAYYNRFSGGAGEGDRPLVVSYASSPPAEFIFSEEPLDEAPTGVVASGCYRQVEFAGVLVGTAREEAAGRLIDFMLSEDFQEEVPLSWFVFPANSTVELPPEFAAHTIVPEDPASLEPDAIEQNRERWIEEWEQVVLG